MSTFVLDNQIGLPSATAGESRSATRYAELSVERSIKLERSTEEERLYGTMAYTGATAAALLQAPQTREPLPEAPRQIL